MDRRSQTSEARPTRAAALRWLVPACVIGVVVSAGLTLPQVLRPVERDAVWAIPVLISTEAMAWGGIAAMLLAAGMRVGNPLTAKNRLHAILDEATGSRGFRLAWVVNVAGALGTSGVIIVIAVGSWPVNAWPLGLLGVVCSLAASGLPFHSRVWRAATRDARQPHPSA